MSDTNNRPVKGATLRGDDKPLPDRGTGTNVTDTYGADLSLTAQNGKGGISSATKSDAPDECFNKKPNTI